MGIFRSEPMSKGTLVLPSEGARDFVEIIASHALVQFVDMNAQSMKRQYKQYIQRLEEMERILRFLYAQIEQHAAAAQEAVMALRGRRELEGGGNMYDEGVDETDSSSVASDTAAAENLAAFLPDSLHPPPPQQPLKQQLLPRTAASRTTREATTTAARTTNAVVGGAENDLERAGASSPESHNSRSSSRSTSRSAFCGSQNTRLRRGVGVSAGVDGEVLRSGDEDAGWMADGSPVGDSAVHLQQEQLEAAAAWPPSREGDNQSRVRSSRRTALVQQPVFQLDRVEEALNKLYTQFVRFSQNNQELLRQRDATIEECALLLLAVQQLQPPATSSGSSSTPDTEEVIPTAAAGGFSSRAGSAETGKVAATLADNSALLTSGEGGCRRRMSPQRASSDAGNESFSVKLRTMAFSTVAGVISSANQEKFARALFRSTRGNAYTYFEPANSGLLPEAYAHALAGKSLFVTYYQGGRTASSAAYEKVVRLCAAFRARCYEWPLSDGEAQRRVAALEVLLMDKAHALRAYENYFLTEIAVLLEPVPYSSNNYDADSATTAAAATASSCKSPWAMRRTGGSENNEEGSRFRGIVGSGRNSRRHEEAVGTGRRVYSSGLVAGKKNNAAGSAEALDSASGGVVHDASPVPLCNLVGESGAESRSSVNGLESAGGGNGSGNGNGGGDRGFFWVGGGLWGLAGRGGSGALGAAGHSSHCNSSGGGGGFFSGERKRPQTLQLREGEMLRGRVGLNASLETAPVKTREPCRRLYGRPLIEEWRRFCIKEKAIYTALNMFEASGVTLRADCWFPTFQEAKLRFLIAQQSSRSHASAFLLLQGRQSSCSREGCSSSSSSFFCGSAAQQQIAPTYFRLPAFLQPFQQLVNTYGVPRHREINPAVFACVFFPFLFGIMYGDVGHGFALLLAAGALFAMHANRKKHSNNGVAAAWIIHPQGETLKALIAGRHMLFLMGFFATYAGLMYNEVLSLGVDLLGSRWRAVSRAAIAAGGATASDSAATFHTLREGEKLQPAARSFPYPFGFDPVWKGATNELLMFNSFKMKFSVIVGFVQMLLGIVLHALNVVAARKWVDFFWVALPQLLLFVSLIGYMVFLILFKWLTPASTHKKPSLINVLINMHMNTSLTATPPPELIMFQSQPQIQQLLRIIAYTSIPCLLLGKPLWLLYHHWRNEQKQQQQHPQQQLLLQSLGGSSRTHSSSSRLHAAGRSNNNNGGFISTAVVARGRLSAGLQPLQQLQQQYGDECCYDVEAGMVHSTARKALTGSERKRAAAAVVLGGGASRGGWIADDDDEETQAGWEQHKQSIGEEEQLLLAGKEEDLSEVFIHQTIETIEFVLGTVSNTASYLRLWALSLAHQQLATVFFEKTIGLAFTPDISVVSAAFRLILLFPVFALITFFVMLCMDSLECFLHALRLQWVEFQGKFFKADGYFFEPLNFRRILRECGRSNTNETKLAAEI